MVQHQQGDGRTSDYGVTNNAFPDLVTLVRRHVPRIPKDHGRDESTNDEAERHLAK